MRQWDCFRGCGFGSISVVNFVGLFCCVCLVGFSGFAVSMERGRVPRLTANEVAGLTVEEDDVCNEENFKRPLVGKVWSDCLCNVWAFKSTIVQTWRLKNTVEIKDLQKNFYLFTFSSRKEADGVLKSGPWSFDRNLLILLKISGEEQPSDLELSRVSFWVRIYDLPFKLRSEAMARKFGNLIGVYEDIDGNEQHRMGCFLCIKISLDLKKPLKRGTTVKYQGRDLWVSFKYERLPNFCFFCGRICHQMKDCEETEDGDDEEDKELEEKDQAYGPWLRASPLPKISDEVKKETSSGTCSKSLFSNSNTTKGDTSGRKRIDEEEVNQVTKPASNVVVFPEIPTLGTVAISTQFHLGETSKSKIVPKAKKWTRKNDSNVPRKPKQATKKKEIVKRTLVEVVVAEGGLEDMMGGGKRQKGDVVMVDGGGNNLEVVLEDQHHRTQ